LNTLRARSAGRTAYRSIYAAAFAPPCRRAPHDHQNKASAAMNTSRRSFVIFSVGIGSSLFLARRALAEPPKLSEADPAAVAVGYREDASKIDKAKYPNYAAGQDCSSCSL